ncbi:unnamed protein product [Urochloa decumbens]|uniref:Receptor-like serine/threonine-protein kinase n=1 Tax=Urochloa decumbens TaxID=240449 RepID=A0ABC9D6Y4_9POAL
MAEQSYLDISKGPLAYLHPSSPDSMYSWAMAVTSFLLVIAMAQLATQTGSVDLPGPSANLSTTWASMNWLIQPTLLHFVPGNSSLAFAAGFHCDRDSPEPPCAFFGVFIGFVHYYLDQAPYFDDYVTVWSANRDHLVQNATLNFTAGGDLLIQDVDGNIVWSTNTSGQSVAGITLTDSGNLVIFDHSNTSVWQSFDYPTDCLLPGQRLVEGMRLIPNTSPTDSSASNLFYLTVLADGLYAFVGSGPPQPYYSYYIDVENNAHNGKPYVSLINGSLATFVSPPPAEPSGMIILPPAVSFQFLRFESDGHLRLYEWNGTWSLREDAFKLDACEYPYVCGDYGVCSNGQCFCPDANTDMTYFKQTDWQSPELGCTQLNPVSCQSLQQYQLIELANVSYFSYKIPSASIETDEESCKLACLRNCSCKAALFHNKCTLLTHVFSLHANTVFKNGAYLKVQLPPSEKHKVILGSVIAGVIFSLIMITFATVVYLRRRNHGNNDEDEFNDLPGMAMRFTFKVLKIATRNFSNKVGQGGFGSVFEGQLDSERVAVKFLDRAGQGKKEFLAEVQTIGSLHHINLVRLIGFCAEKSYRLLVFEYIPRGSLDQWIYPRDKFVPLDWLTRCKIITDIARGLSYLHEDCRQRIAHLDIKPQNILLDDNFNAKLSDFGLSKLIDRGESYVMTRMRGTPGYMAPEWLTSQITEKVDVYSFGIVVMEIISGRKNLDYSQTESDVQLISLLQDAAKNDLLEDMIDKSSDDMHLHKDEVIAIIKLAMWCLQSDKNRRPAMSVVVKVMEGERSVASNLDYNFFDLSPAITAQVGESKFSDPPVVSVLSGPR